MRLRIDNIDIDLKVLYRTLYPKIRVYVMQNSGREADAKDIFQEALLAAWINYKKDNFQGNKSEFEAYIYTIAKYKWLDQVKSKTKKSTIRLDDTRQIKIDENLYEEVDSSGLMAAIQQLGGKCKNLLDMFYFERISLIEIGIKMGYSADVVKTTKYRCMMKLREIYLNNNDEKV